MNKGTNRKLHIAYTELIKKEEKISVTMLCEKAGVSRATFYLYYRDIDEFIKKSNEYIILKLWDQMELILKTSDKELGNVIKRKNIIFEEHEIELLDYYCSGNRYISFAIHANELIIPRHKKLMTEKWGEEYYNANADKFDFFLNAFVPLVFFNLINYDEAKFRYEMMSLRNISSGFFTEVMDDIRKGNDA